LTTNLVESKGGKSKGLGKAKVPLAIAGGAAAGAGIGLLAANAGSGFGGGHYGRKDRLSCYACESRFSQECSEISMWSTPTFHCPHLGDNCVKITDLSTGMFISLVEIGSYWFN